MNPTMPGTAPMNWLRQWLTANLDRNIMVSVTNLNAHLNEVRVQQVEIMKTLTAINQSVAKLLLKHAQDPQEMTNEERAALLGLPPSMAELVDWDQMRRR